MNNLIQLIEHMPERAEVAAALKLFRTPVSVTGCADSQKCHLAASLFEPYKNALYVAGNELHAREVYEDLRLYDRDVFYYPAKDLIFYNADVKGTAVVKERMAVIRKILSGEKVTIVTSVDALLDKILPPERLKKNVLVVRDTDILDVKALKAQLTSIGYERQDQVSGPGEFAIRGGIIDIFPLNEDLPTRIELFDDEVDSMRTFDAESQRSGENSVVHELVVYPASEYILTDSEMEAGFARIRDEEEGQEYKFRAYMQNEEATRLKHSVQGAIDSIEMTRGRASVDSFAVSFYDDLVSFIDYFDKDSLILFDEPVRMEEKAEAVTREFQEGMMGRLTNGYILPSQADVIWGYKDVFARASRKRLAILSALEYGFAGIKVKESFNIYTRNINNYTTSFELLVRDVQNFKSKNYKTVIVTGSQARAKRLTDELREAEVNAVYVDDPEREILQGEVIVVNGPLHKGFEYISARVAVLAEGDSFGADRKKNKKKRAASGREVMSLHELSFGDYVVHEHCGLGIYRGIMKLEQDKTAQDYVKIEYGDGTLYIPATGLETIQKYASGDADKKPKISKLNSPEWHRTHERVKHAVADIAEQLVKLYAIRSTRPGFSFSPDNTWVNEFEELFPYEETEDQLKAIEDTKRDMESGRIMDRLICGDVGFGKTEIALRAAFKAVQDNKQVVVLVPTTILAQQHYNTFKSRMMKYPVTVELLSRFRTPAQQRETLKGVAAGTVDILIGTHRVLSQDVKFKNLGLLVVDEEQRFGVTHKEKIKEMKKDVDVLTLTATPIPRTLHMSLSGIRDMSVLEEAPVDRLPIQTFVMEHNDELIREAISREAARGGQVYFVYNRVNGIEEKAARIQELCPELSVVFAHGQMSERELERIMYDFVSGEIDVLVATTIIETGLDISNVNTIIIDNADKMGLSQLYQLRGRVGRSDRTAYAFLMYSRGQVLTEVAEKRLKAIRDFTELGSGFRIAMRDLEIRGAGNVLGAEQSGHMAEVGYDLYCKMLDTAIRKVKGEEVELDEFDTVIKMSIDAYIPDNYIKNETQKLDMYKRIAMVETEEERMDVLDELTDRYGEPPVVVDNLLHVAKIKATCHSLYITQLVSAGDVIKFWLFPRARYKTELIDKFLTDHSPMAKLTWGDNPCITYILPKEKKKLTQKETEKRLLESITAFLEDMKVLI